MQTHVTFVPPSRPADSSLYKVALLNARSVRNKTTILNEFLTENRIDLIFLTETWLDNASGSTIAGLLPPGFFITHVPRNESIGRGGGVGLLFRENLTVSVFKPPVELPNYRSLEHLHCVLSLNEAKVHLIAVYRPPSAYTFTHLMSSLMSTMISCVLLIYTCPFSMS